jgi:hypothetical protein
MTTTLPAMAQPAYLTEALNRAGVLGEGRVVGVEVMSSFGTMTAAFVRLRLACEGAAAGAPRSLILKAAHPDRRRARRHGARQEVAFYRDIAPMLPPGVVPRCFDAVWSDGSDIWHLLLEDLTDTHAVATPWPLPPGLAQCESMVAALARFHAAWWDDPRLPPTEGQATALEMVRRQAAGLDRQVARFADTLGDALSPRRRAFYARYLEAAPGLMERRLVHRRRTFVHGDAHVWNYFLPKHGGADAASAGVRLFDWDGWHLGAGADDLAYMMAVHWHPELRGLREARLLDRYHGALLAHGVRGFDRAALQEDYRLSVLLASTVPILQHAAGVSPAVWWHHLDRIHLAIEDLGCLDLLP